MRNGTKDKIHACGIYFNCDSALDTEEIMPQVMSSERVMNFKRQMRIEEQDGELLVRSRGLPNYYDTLGAIYRLYKDFPRLASKLLDRKSLPKAIVSSEKKNKTHIYEGNVVNDAQFQECDAFMSKSATRLILSRITTASAASHSMAPTSTTGTSRTWSTRTSRCSSTSCSASCRPRRVPSANSDS